MVQLLLPIRPVGSILKHTSGFLWNGNTTGFMGFLIMENEIKTTHNLNFEMAPSIYGDMNAMFKVGTCEGLFGCTADSYYILAITNKFPGNGHLNDVFEWFEHSAKRDKKNLLVLECMNDLFYKHLLSKRGFVPLDAKGENCIKVFNRKQYRRLLKNGNEIIQKETLTCI